MHEVLAIFPSRGLDNSILVPIFFGLVFHSFLIERFGWSFAGLVVPGYLAAVFAIAPQAGVIIILEIVTTYAIVYFISETLSRIGWWHSFFGRDRFLLFFVVSLLVRLVYEVWFFQNLVEFTTTLVGVELGNAQHLYGIGLVIVPLASHAMWRTGIRRGIVQVFVPTALTYLVLTQILVPYTNFSIANFELTFQDLALDFASSPKIYITLIVGMLLAARLNLRLGWDFNGIMVPSLLAVAWYMPWKILTTVAEATIIVGISWLIASLPIFRRSNLEGARRLLLIFTVGLGFKYLLGAYFESTNPGFKVSDLFGFGYLLPSLIALNIWEHRSFSLVVGPTLVTSFSAFLIGNIIGLGLYQLDRVFIEQIVASDNIREVSVEIPESPEDTLLLAGVATLPMVPEEFVQTTPANRLRYQRVLAGVRQLARSARAGEEPKWITRDFAEDLKRLNLELAWLTDDAGRRRLLVLREALDSSLDRLQGWGTAVFTPGCQSGVVLEVPFPYEEPSALDAAVVLHHQLGSCALYVNGWRTFRPGETAVLRRAGSPFAIAHEILAVNPVVQVRTWNRATTVFIQNRVPAGVDLEVFKSQFPDYRLSWRAYDEERPGANLGFSQQIEIVLNEDALLNFWPSVAVPDGATAHPSGLSTLRDRLRRKHHWINPPASEGYRIPSALEMEFLEDRVVRPLRLALGREQADTPEGRDLLAARLGLIQARARMLGFTLSTHLQGPHQVEVLLYEPRPERGWGLYLFRSGAGRWVVEVARPMVESGTLEIGLDTYGRLDAQTLMIAGADLDARYDGMAEITRTDNAVNPFHSVHRGLYPLHPTGAEPWTLQIRGLAASRDNMDDVIVTVGEDLVESSPRQPMLASLLRDLRGMGVSHSIFGGTLDQIGLKGVDNLQLRYSAALISQSAAVAWYSPRARLLQPSLDPVARQVQALRHHFSPPYSEEALEELPLVVSDRPLSERFALARDHIRRFVETQDPGHWIAAASVVEHDSDLTENMIQDSASGKAFYVIRSRSLEQWCITRLEQAGESVVLSPDSFERDKALRNLRYGAVGVLCNAEVSP